MPHTHIQAPPITRRHRKVRVGRVVSNKMTKTIVVRVEHLVRHRLYSRVMRRAKTFQVHDETNSAGIGDWVKIMETRPLSKKKRWRLVEILKRASAAPPVPGGESEVSPAQRPSNANGSDTVGEVAG